MLLRALKDELEEEKKSGIAKYRDAGKDPPRLGPLRMNQKESSCILQPGVPPFCVVQKLSSLELGIS